ncbi:MAG: hypothetical protein IT569_05095 [Leptospiraceae bacterium]|nr:hypothetical protein [Leptospiraceae bacterium]
MFQDYNIDSFLSKKIIFTGGIEIAKYIDQLAGKIPTNMAKFPLLFIFTLQEEFVSLYTIGDHFAVTFQNIPIWHIPNQDL